MTLPLLSLTIQCELLLHDTTKIEQKANVKGNKMFFIILQLSLKYKRKVLNKGWNATVKKNLVCKQRQKGLPGVKLSFKL